MASQFFTNALAAATLVGSERLPLDLAAGGSEYATVDDVVTFATPIVIAAIPKTSSSVFGLAKVDGTTIVAVAGVISAPGASSVGAPASIQDTGAAVLLALSDASGQLVLDGLGDPIFAPEVFPAAAIPALPYAPVALPSGDLFVGSAGNVATAVALSGDATLANTGALTLASTISAAGPIGDATHVAAITYDAKGRLTTVSSVAITQPAGANPTATIGSSAVNGTATTFMRSDGAPALPATLPALSGVNLTSLNASNLGSGTVPAARLPNPSASTLGGIESLAAVTSNWIDSISTSGVPHASQPSTTDISDITTGTWIPVDNSGGGITFTITTATYLRVGNTVFIQMSISLAVTANGANFQLKGLPYTPSTAANVFATMNAGPYMGLLTSGGSIYLLTTGSVFLTNANCSAQVVTLNGIYTK